MYTNGTLLVSQATGEEVTSSDPRIEDQGDGTARVQFDRVVPWSVAIELLDTLARNAVADDMQEAADLLSR